MIVYLDLDRTLFRTELDTLIWRKIESLSPDIDAEEAIKNRPNFFIHVVDQYTYDMSAQLRSLSLDPEATYAELQKTDLADGRFEFEGVHELVDYLSDRSELSIYSFGPDDYQRFKAALCPSLRGLPMITTLRAKSEALSDSGEECWLVDDKPIGDELPGNVSFVQVAHETEPISSDDPWPLFYNLKQVKEFFHEVLH